MNIIGVLDTVDELLESITWPQGHSAPRNFQQARDEIQSVIAHLVAKEEQRRLEQEERYFLRD